MRWHCPTDAGYEIRAPAVWGPACYLSVTVAPHNIDSLRVSDEEIFCFFATWRPEWDSNPRFPTFQAGSFNHCIKWKINPVISKGAITISTVKGINQNCIICKWWICVFKSEIKYFVFLLVHLLLQPTITPTVSENPFSISICDKKELTVICENQLVICIVRYLI